MIIMKRFIISMVCIGIASCFQVISQDGLTENLNIESNDTENIFVDPRDNQEYRYIVIGNIKWMAENLNYKTPNSLTYNNIEENGKVLGRLYSWEEAKCACPDSWRLPTDEEWKSLETYIGIKADAIDSVGWRGGSTGNTLKSKISNVWSNTNLSNKQDIGFNAIASGLAYKDNYFAYKGLGVYFWTATNYYSSYAWSRYLSSDRSDIFRNISIISWHLSVRCVQN